MSIVMMVMVAVVVMVVVDIGVTHRWWWWPIQYRWNPHQNLLIVGHPLVIANLPPFLPCRHLLITVILFPVWRGVDLFKLWLWHLVQPKYHPRDRITDPKNVLY